MEATYEVGYYLKNPVWLNQDDSTDVEHTGLLAEKWLVLDPGDNIM